MARTASAVAGRKIDIEQRKEQFNETQAEMQAEIKKLVEKIGIVNVIALLHALNGADVVDVSSPYSEDFKAYGWFSLDVSKGIVVRVDDKLRWQERWCKVQKINFGLK